MKIIENRFFIETTFILLNKLNRKEIQDGSFTLGRFIKNVNKTKSLIYEFCQLKSIVKRIKNGSSDEENPKAIAR